MSHFTMYLIVMLDNISAAFVAATVACVALAVMCLLGGFITADTAFGKTESEERAAKAFTVARRAGWVAIPLLLVAMSLPNTKQAAVIYLVPKIVNTVGANEQVQKLPDNFLKLLNTKMEQWVADMNKADAKPETESN